MHPKNNNIDAAKHRGGGRYRTALLSPESPENSRHYSEAMHAVLDELHSTATSRRAALYNLLQH